MSAFDPNRSFREQRTARSIAEAGGGASTIHVVDDHAFRTAVGRVLERSGYRVAYYSSAEEALNSLSTADRGCVVLDIEMGGMSGLQLQQELVLEGCLLPIIFLTEHGDVPESVRAIKAGAEDFLPKPVKKAVLLDAIERALTRCDTEFEKTARLRSLHALVRKLTPREYEVFKLVVSGLMSKQIAHKLGPSERTIKEHRHQIMQKMNVGSIVELVSLANELKSGGLLQLD